MASGFGRSMGNEKLYKDKVDIMVEFSLLGRLPVPEDIAHLAVFLASDDAVNITGSIMVSDAGAILK